MSNKAKNSPMYFSSLEVENVKCFGKQTLDLKDSNGAISPWTLILGDNGVGKTTLLKCLAWMIPVEATLEDEIKEKRLNTSDLPEKTEGNIIVELPVDNKVVKIKPFMDGFDNDSDYEHLIKLGENLEYRVGATFTNGIELRSVPDDNIVSHAINVRIKSGKLEDITLEFGKLTEFNSPNLYAYSASRHMEFKNFENSELKNPIFNLFSYSGDLYDAEQLLTLFDNAAIRQNGIGKAADLLKKIKQILVDLLPDINNPDCIIINSPINEDGSLNKVLVEVQTSDGKVQLFDLSLGYQTMLAWTLDLAFRMFLLNPDSDAPLQEPAIVIVDEIDLHLHPKWQRVIRKKLTNHFPRTQFICTAHSPFMAQSSEFENLCVINRVDGEVCIQNEPLIVKGWRIGQVATSDLFGIPSERGPDEEELVNKRRMLLDKANRTPDEEIELERLDRELSKLPVEVGDENQKLLDQIREAADLLRKVGKIK